MEKLNSFLSRIFKNRGKMDLKLSSGAVFHAEFESRSKIAPKPPKPDFYRFSRNYDFYKILFLTIFIGAAASAGGPF